MSEATAIECLKAIVRDEDLSTRRFDIGPSEAAEILARLSAVDELVEAAENIAEEVSVDLAIARNDIAERHDDSPKMRCVRAVRKALEAVRKGEEG